MTERVGVVTCSVEDIDPDSPVLLEALARAGVSAELVVWDDPAVDWDRYALSVIRSTWDYVDKFDQFRAWVARTPRLVNPAAAVEYSLDKHYLGDLAERGVDVVPTTFVDVGVAPSFPEGHFVVKPAIGAGSMSAERYDAAAIAAARDHVRALHEDGRDVLVQPYVASVDTDGECALIFVEGEFSHAVRKGPMLNVPELDRRALYRQELISVMDPPHDAVQTGQRVLESLGLGELLYARVDVLRDGNRWLLLELELVEPSLFLAFDPTVGDRLARAIAHRVSI